MKAEFELTVEDYLELTTVHTARSPTVRRQRRSGLLIGCILLMALPTLVLVTSDKPVGETVRAIWPLLTAPILFLLTVIPYIRWKTSRMAKRMLLEGGPSGFSGPCSLAIETGGLVETRAAGVTTRHWDSVEKILVTATHVFIYTSAIEAFVLPQRAFTSSEEGRQFVEQVSQRSGVQPEDV
jgi:hypothetical protein